MKQPDRIEVKKDGPHYFLGHAEVQAAAFRKVYPLPDPGEPGDCFAGNPLTGWPLVSNAAGVHPKQIGEAMALDKKLGVGDTEYTPAGDVKFSSRDHRRRWLHAHDMIDRSSFTGY